MESEHVHGQSVTQKKHAIGYRVGQTTLLKIHRAMLIASLVGLFASVYLFITYVSGKPIACGLLSGCEVVRASKWAYTFGVPRPLLGILFYFGVIALLSFRAYAPHYRPQWWRSAILLVATVGFIESGFLTLVQWLDIKAFCTWCVTSAIAATVLFFLAWFDGREPTARGAIVKELKYIFIAFAMSIVIGSVALYFLLGDSVGGKPQVITTPTSTTDIDAQILPPGTPVEGPATSTATIIEFLDFECPSCGAFHPTLKKIREEYAGRIRFALRMFPIPELHPNARGAAIAAQCVLKQKEASYFEFADALMANQRHLKREDLTRYAEAFDVEPKAFEACLDDASVSAFVDAERKAGEKLGVEATPTILVNHNFIQGVMTYDQLKLLVDAALVKE